MQESQQSQPFTGAQEKAPQGNNATNAITQTVQNADMRKAQNTSARKASADSVRAAQPAARLAAPVATSAPLRIAVPPVGLEGHQWIADSFYSRSARRKASGTYYSTIPAKLAAYPIALPTTVSADIADATAALSSFDTYAAAHLTARTLGPMSAVLLRTESTSSSQIENLTVGARKLALESLGEHVGGNASIVVGNVRAMEAALKLSHDLSESSILAMHRALLGGEPGWERIAGHYREQLVWVGTTAAGPRGASHVAPQPELVPECMSDLLAFIDRDDLPPLVQCAIAHAQFETIHPFVDGNGRVGRTLVHAMLRNKGVVTRTSPPVSAGILHDTANYFDALTQFRRGDALPIVTCFIEAAQFAADSGRKLIDALEGELDADESKLGSLRKDASGRRLLPHLIEQPIVNAAFVQQALNTSRATAQRAIEQLTQAGVLVERTGMRRNRVWEEPGVIEILDDYAAGIKRA